MVGDFDDNKGSSVQNFSCVQNFRSLGENEYEGVPVNFGAIKDLYDNYATYF